MTQLLWAKAAAVFSVIYGGANIYQFWVCYGDVKEKSKIFAEMVAEAGGVGTRLRVVRALFYLAAPLFYLWALRGAGLPGVFLLAAGAKLGASSILGLSTEHRLLSGGEYRKRDHVFARADAALNIALAVTAVWWVLRAWT